MSRTREPVAYRLHPGAVRFAIIAAIILALFVIPLPFAVACYLAASRGKLVFHEEGIDVTYLFTKRIRFHEVVRLGLLRVTVPTTGIAAYLARMECFEGENIHLCVLDRRGKTRSVQISLYECCLEILDRFQEAVGKPYEQVALGVFNFKWPEASQA